MNGDKINGRTLDEIKKGLECRVRWGNGCSLNCSECNVFVPGMNGVIMAADALAYIQQLEREKSELVSENYKLKRERDAAVEQLKEVDRLELFCCSHCKHEELDEDDFSCTTCIHMSNWEWIGA